MSDISVAYMRPTSLRRIGGRQKKCVQWSADSQTAGMMSGVDFGRISSDSLPWRQGGEVASYTEDILGSDILVARPSFACIYKFS